MLSATYWRGRGIHVDVELGDVTDDWEQTARRYLGDYGARPAPDCIEAGSTPIESLREPNSRVRKPGV